MPESKKSINKLRRAAEAALSKMKDTRNKSSLIEYIQHMEDKTESYNEIMKRLNSMQEESYSEFREERNRGDRYKRLAEKLADKVRTYCNHIRDSAVYTGQRMSPDQSEGSQSYTDESLEHSEDYDIDKAEWSAGEEERKSKNDSKTLHSPSQNLRVCKEQRPVLNETSQSCEDQSEIVRDVFESPETS